jgi:hypothetical protein
MQVSCNSLWFLVEGRDDKVFLSNICAQNQSAGSLPYTLALADEIDGAAAKGKQALLMLYRKLRSKQLLLTDFKGKRTAVVFFLDKDIDDLLRTKAKSDHVIYTDLFCMENYLCACGHIASALAAAEGLDVAAVKQSIGPTASGWCRRVVNRWREWTEYCVLVAFRRIPRCPNYGTKGSLFHPEALGPCNDIRAQEYWSRAQHNSGMTPTQFAAARRKVAQKVENVFRAHKHDAVFNGLWYIRLLIEEGRSIAGGARQARATPKSLVASLLTTLDYSAAWSKPIHSAIDRVCTLFRT